MMAQPATGDNRRGYGKKGNATEDGVIADEAMDGHDGQILMQGRERKQEVTIGQEGEGKR